MHPSHRRQIGFLIGIAAAAHTAVGQEPMRSLRQEYQRFPPALIQHFGVDKKDVRSFT